MKEIDPQTFSLDDFRLEGGRNGGCLGKGSFSNVRLVRNIKTGKYYA